MALVLVIGLAAGCSSAPPSTTATTSGAQRSHARLLQTLALRGGREPVASYGTTAVYFAPMREIVLFGGADAFGHGMSDTWVFDRHGWRRLHPPESPPGRAQYAMAYDPALRQIVLYGGCTFCGAPGYRLVRDTWAFNGRTWHQLHSDRLPTFEPSPLLAWDLLTRSLELLAPPPGYGSNPPNGDFNATGGSLGRWVWHRSGWAWTGPTAGPPLFIQASAFVPVPRSSTMLYFSYQPYSGTCPMLPGRVVCGGDPSGLRYSQTWSWNGRFFTKNRPARAPTSSEAVTADPGIGRVIVVAGSHVWEWTGATWMEQRARTPDLGPVTAAYDPAIGAVIIWGMTTTAQHSAPETWAWDGYERSVVLHSS